MLYARSSKYCIDNVTDYRVVCDKSCLEKKICPSDAKLIQKLDSVAGEVYNASVIDETVLYQAGMNGNETSCC